MMEIMSKKVGFLAMAVLMLMAISAGATSSEVDEVIELPSDEANMVVATNMEMWSRKMMKEGDRKGSGNGLCLIVGTPCNSDENCFSGCRCKTTPILKLGICSPF
ncbi:hypothetical protein E6C27_scaffold46G00550 [Cucumis melo var. makuwa]|uniref:Uncharacterized protein n=1 Tax=Cucumis melo var. makuwa TaxID=1194695 RepID=A0A5A7TM06_CUCMM|nr:hypothetical protein E6C27_scaffold46G00550 [Cucumis melo var. makuwa]